MASVPTVLVHHPSNPDEVMRINASDFDPSRHRRVGADEAQDPPAEPTGDVSRPDAPSFSASAKAESTLSVPEGEDSSVDLVPERPSASRRRKAKKE